MILNQANLSILFTMFKTSFQNGFDGVKPDWNKIATEIPSSTKTNLYQWLGQFPKFREWLGARQVKNIVSHDYSLANQKFESTVAVPATDIQDDQFGAFGKIFELMGDAAASHPDELVFALFLLGATELCYDGQPFFNASHPIITDGVATTTSNYDVTGAGNLWALLDASRPLKPLIWQKREPYSFQTFTRPSDPLVFMEDEYLYGSRGRSVPGFGFWQMAYGSLNTLNGTNFDAYRKVLRGYKSDEGRPLGVKPTLLICGPSNEAAAETLLKDKLISTGGTNRHFGAAELLVTPFLV